MQNSYSIKKEILELTADTLHNIPDPVIGQLINEVHSDNTDIKSSKDKETDAFLDEVNKKKISNEIRQRNQKKKLQCESIVQ